MVNKTAAAVDFEVTIGGTPINSKDVDAFACEMDLGQPDFCAVTLRNMSHDFNDKFKPGDALELKIGGGTRYQDEGGGSSKPSVFKGEVVGFDSHYKQGGESRLTVRAFNKMHRLLRGRKSKTWQDKSDQDIVSDIVSKAGLSAKTGSTPKITHKHVYQHNQTDLDFIRTRAARLGFEVWCEDTTLHFEAPKLDADSGLEFKLDKDPDKKLRSFNVRISNAQCVKKVTVRAWDPEKKTEIVGEASAASSPLCSKNAASTLSSFGEVATFTVDTPCFSKQEADAIAKAKLGELSMSYISGDAEVTGHNGIKPGIVVKLTVNLKTASDRFNGKYLVRGCTHHFSHQKGEDGGYKTIIRVGRDGDTP
jgi:phage protein D